jgi:TonB family protein
MPVPIWEEKPQYTSDAMRARIQGVAEVEAVVLENGTVGELRIHKSLDRIYGLDQRALAAASKWRFKPATLNGVPTKVRVLIVLEFRVR